METNPLFKEPITILIAVAVRLYREGLAATLNGHERLRVEAAAETPLEALAVVRDRRPDVVIVDVALDDVLSLIRGLRAESSSSRILAFAVREDITAILTYAEAGADGFVTASSSIADLIEAIERTAAGELLCSPRIAAQLLRRAAHKKTSSAEAAIPLLTNREQQVLSLLKQGRTNKEIGVVLHVAEATVKNHVHHLLEKLHVNTRGQAAACIPPLKASLGMSTSARRAG